MKKLVLVTVGLLLCSCNVDVYAEENDSEGDSIIISASEKDFVDDGEFSEYTELENMVYAETSEVYDKLTPGIIIEGYPAEGVVYAFKEDAYDPNEPHLTKQAGVFYGPSGKETYYNLPMGRVISYMRDLGYTTEEYPYWVRADGAKMLGDYVMVAADLSVYSKGTIVPTSLGKGIVCDTGAFAGGSVALDIAVTW